MHKQSEKLFAMMQSFKEAGAGGPYKILMHPETLSKIQADEPLDHIEPQDDGSVLWCGCRLETDWEVDKDDFFLFMILPTKEDK